MPNQIKFFGIMPRTPDQVGIPPIVILHTFSTPREEEDINPIPLILLFDQVERSSEIYVCLFLFFFFVFLLTKTIAGLLL